MSRGGGTVLQVVISIYIHREFHLVITRQRHPDCFGKKNSNSVAFGVTTTSAYLFFDPEKKMRVAAPYAIVARTSKPMPTNEDILQLKAGGKTRVTRS